MRSLLEIAVEAHTGTGSVEGFGLICADSLVPLVSDPRAHAAAGVRSGAVLQNAAEVTAHGGTLSVLLLVRLEESDLGDVHVVDGWSLVRSHGARADLREAPLRGADLRGARLSGANLADADLRGADLEKADLSGADLTGANLCGAVLHRAGLRGADLTEADLCRADLRHADLQEAVLVRTALRGADLWESYLWNVDVSTAFTEGVDLDRASLPENLGTSR